MAYVDNASNPYFDFGVQRQYPFKWHGGAGGQMGGRSAEARELSGANLIESGYMDANALPFPALSRTNLHAVGDLPLVRPSGPEPSLGFFDHLSDNEQKLALVGGAAVVAFVLLRRRRRAQRGRRR